MSNDVVHYEAADHVAVITIDRPEARNAISPAVAQGLEAAVDAMEADPDVWVGILTSTGPVFCAGADLKEVAAGNGAALATERGGFGGFVARARNTPMICAAQGTAVAGGCELLLACELVVLAETAQVGLPEVKRSLVAAAGGLFRLPRVVGPAVAAEMILTGDPIDAERAYATGLVNQVVPVEEVLPAAHALAQRIAANAPLAVQASRRIMLRADLEGDDELFRASNKATAELSRTEDFAEGPRAFIEKRPPVWKGR